MTSAEAARRLQQGGANAIADVAQHPVTSALGKLWAPVPWMLDAAILLQLYTGAYIEAGVVGLLLVFNAALGFVQEGRAQATIDALKSQLALLASVQRDGAWLTVKATTIVADDVVKLSLGAVVAADVRLATGSILVDQSMLTGESLPVEATTGAIVYAGALVRRGEAVGQVVAIGAGTKFGRTAELVRSAKFVSSEQKAIVRVVRNLAFFNGGVTLVMAGYAFVLAMPGAEITSLILVAVLASIPVALPSMFTLAAAVGARSLAAGGVLPTSLAAVDEAGSIDVLCADKTGTLTRNELAVTAVHALPGFDEARVLNLAALASSDGGQDPVDAAIRAEALRRPLGDAPELVTFVPFDPAAKRSAATVRGSDGAVATVVKAAFGVVQNLSQTADTASAMVDELQAKGFRVLAVASGPPKALRMVGLIALSDPPREDSTGLVVQLRTLGVRTIMVTGDARRTAEVVAAAIGITGPVSTTTPLPDDFKAQDFAVFAGVLPEDKYRLVKSLQMSGHIVGMCGDGANDAPALRQAQMGIAVSTATDVAKASAGMVLTAPGLGGVVAAVQEGRKTYQRILTYTLRTLIHKVNQVLLLGFGLIITGRAILTPMLMVLLMVTGDFLAMASSADNVRPSPQPSVWRIGPLTIAAILMGLCDLLFCTTCLALGKYELGLTTMALRSLTVVLLVLTGQAVLYAMRDRRHLWSSRPGRLLMLSSVVDVGIVGVLAANGFLMTALPMTILAGLFVAACVFALVLDSVKAVLFYTLKIA